MMLTILCSFLFSVQDTVTAKPNDEFEVTLEYEFKKRPAQSANEIMLNEANGGFTPVRDAGPLPYVVMKLKITKASQEEKRLKVFRDNKIFLNKRGIENGTEVKIDLGFTDDMKDRVSPYEYIFFFLDDKKKEVSKIIIFIEEDGTFLVNGEKRGKF